MRLNIKNKLIFLILAAVLICAGGMVSISFVKMTDMAVTAFEESSLSELQQVDNFISEFMHEAQLNAKFIAGEPAVVDSLGHNLNLVEDLSLSGVRRELMNEKGKEAFDLIERI